MQAFSRQLRGVFGRKYRFPRNTVPDWLCYLIGPFRSFSWRYLSRNLGYTFQFDNSYSKKDLGMEYRSVTQTLVDQIKDLEEKGLL